MVIMTYQAVPVHLSILLHQVARVDPVILVDRSVLANLLLQYYLPLQMVLYKTSDAIKDMSSSSLLAWSPGAILERMYIL